MGVARRIAKKVVHATLLRFPGGDPQATVACVYCPELCRFSCPTALVSGNDAVTPSNKMGLPYKEGRWPGRLAEGGARELWPIYDCTGCGRCTEYCAYQMPVAQRLFEAREKHGWGRAREVAARLTDAEDPWGDLAEELGDRVNAKRRREAIAASPGRLRAVDEPKAAFGLREFGARWAGEDWLKADPKAVVARLAGKRWLIHESVWASRRLGLHEEVRQWARAAQAEGAKLVWAFHQGRDCIDCGGEGAYARLFPEQAAQMARELWGRDRGRADGILCFSERCAEHLRGSLGGRVPVSSVGGRGSGDVL